MRSSCVWVLCSLLVFGQVLVPSWAGEKPPERSQPLSGASRLVLVETQDFHSSDATISTYERQLPDGAWREVGVAAPAKIGRAGLGWGYTFRHLAQAGEPLKREGDKRAPAGIFALSRPFGFGSSRLMNYMQLERGRHVCVDDVGSTHYSRIVNLGTAGVGTSGERMWAVDLYRKGILIDYPTSRAAKAGSCIFVHLWRRPDKSTVGCVAASEPTVDRLQEWANDPKDRTVIAIVPSTARERLPGLPVRP